MYWDFVIITSGLCYEDFHDDGIYSEGFGHYNVTHKIYIFQHIFNMLVYSLSFRKVFKDPAESFDFPLKYL